MRPLVRTCPQRGCNILVESGRRELSANLATATRDDVGQGESSFRRLNRQGSSESQIDGLAYLMGNTELTARKRLFFWSLHRPKSNYCLSSIVFCESLRERAVWLEKSSDWMHSFHHPGSTTPVPLPSSPPQLQTFFALSKRPPPPLSSTPNCPVRRIVWPARATEQYTTRPRPSLGPVNAAAIQGRGEDEPARLHQRPCWRRRISHEPDFRRIERADF